MLNSFCIPSGLSEKVISITIIITFLMKIRHNNKIALVSLDEHEFSNTDLFALISYKINF
jgi:hypothetical protein